MHSTRLISYPLDVNGLSTRILQANGGGEPVFCLHGLGARADRWRSSLPVLASAGYNAIAIDLPGHGFAVKGNGIPVTVPTLSEFVMAILQRLGVTSAHLVGTSLGGHISAHVTCNYPAMVRSLTLVGTVGILPIGRDAGLAIQASIQQTSREAIRKKLDLVLARTDLIDDPLIEEEYWINNSLGAAASFRLLGEYMVEQLDKDCVFSELAELTGSVPIQLIWGAEDKVVPLSVGQSILNAIGLPDSALSVIQDAGHAPYMEQPEAFHEILLPYLAKHRISPDQ